MPLDGLFLHQLTREINTAVGCRIEKVYQPSREELVLLLRGREGGLRLLLSASPTSARVHFTTAAVENPKAPPMFCMLLRKHLNNAKLIRVEQVGRDRILHLVFETTNELGDIIHPMLCAEIMGRTSNILFLSEEGKVIDAIKRVDFSTSEVRPILPGLPYQAPPSQGDRLDICLDPSEAILQKVKESRTELELSKRLLECMQGFSPLICREIACEVFPSGSGRVEEMTGAGEERFVRALDALREVLLSEEGMPTLLRDPDGRPKDVTFLPVQQYKGSMILEPAPSFSALLDRFYEQKDATERMKQRSSDLLKVLTTLIERTGRRVETQKQELRQSVDRDRYRIFGDLLSSNLHLIQKGDRSVTVQNYYEEDLPEVEIPLDPLKTPSQNVQKYYLDYRKADTAEKKLTVLIQKGEEEKQYLESVYDILTRARGEEEIEAIRRELEEEGYLRRHTRKAVKLSKLPPIRYRSSDGFVILVGRNNTQNDQLTLKTARGSDLWLHTQKIPGSHTIVLTEGAEVPDRTVEEAAILAATHSQARDSSRVPVDYTKVRNVKKPNGAKPGMVIYETYQTAIVTPDEQLAERLREKN